MYSHKYLAADPARGEVTLLSSIASEPPEPPKSVDGRRLDLFETYRQGIRAYRNTVPLQIYTTHFRQRLTLATANHGVDGTAVRTIDGVRLTDLFAQTENSAHLLDDPTPLCLEGPTAVLLEVNGGKNYYHWLMTSLPRLLALMQRYPRQRFDHFVVNDTAPAFVLDSLALLGVPLDAVISAAKHPVVRVSEAFCSVVSSNLFYPNQLIVELFRQILPRPLYRGRRLFISRTGGRSIANEPEVLDVLTSFGFETIRTERLSLLEQIQLFASAEVVVGAHGAGFSNLVFCQTGTKVLEFFSPKFLNVCYWFLSAACRHEYHCLLGYGEDAPLESDLWRSELAATITLDCGILRRMLEKMNL